MAVTVTNTTNKSLYKKIDDSGKYSCVIDLEKGTNNKLETTNKTIVGAINEINDKATNIITIDLGENGAKLTNDFMFPDDILQLIFNTCVTNKQSFFKLKNEYTYEHKVLNNTWTARDTYNILFTLKSNIKSVTNISSPTFFTSFYLFDGYYATTSTIYKIYLVLAADRSSTTFTQQSIKIEEYATF